MVNVPDGSCSNLVGIWFILGELWQIVWNNVDVGGHGMDTVSHRQLPKGPVLGHIPNNELVLTSVAGMSSLEEGHRMINKCFTLHPSVSDVVTDRTGLLIRSYIR